MARFYPFHRTHGWNVVVMQAMRLRALERSCNTTAKSLIYGGCFRRWLWIFLVSFDSFDAYLQHHQVGTLCMRGWLQVEKKGGMNSTETVAVKCAEHELCIEHEVVGEFQTIAKSIAQNMHARRCL